ncbi:MAG: UMP kinase [Candidatus Marinimicrobia bacterium]|nr:UMP kinase [Candidatus Neomarinimicrobiota bacterium]
MNYNRILLKLSGEVLGGVKGHGIDPDAASYFSQEVKQIHDKKVQIGIVIGGGNIFRGAKNITSIERVTGDHMGMLATVINALALRDTFEKAGMKSLVMVPQNITGLTPAFNRQKALELLDQGTIVIFAGGTGNPYFTTDSAAALRASEIDADILLKGTKVDGVYTADPMEDPSASRYDTVSYNEAIDKNLRIMDMSAMALCRDNVMPIKVFNFTKAGELLRVVSGQSVGTLITE